MSTWHKDNLEATFETLMDARSLHTMTSLAYDQCPTDVNFKRLGDAVRILRSAQEVMLSELELVGLSHNVTFVLTPKGGE